MKKLSSLLLAYPDLPAGQLQPGMIGSFYDPTVGPIAQPTA
ncbi:MAG TPA: hypothetical protein VMZ73_03345 [Acidimicrobiales bacterium]|nr:hypothetical protein [Acidimicrobiales bacterium]